MIKPIRKDEDLLNDLTICEQDENNFYLWWLGQSGYLITYKKQRVLIDPYLSDSLTKKYKDSSKPHIRMSELVIDPAKLTGISVVTSSHNHTDHLDAETLIPLIGNNPGIKMIIPEANRNFVSERIQMPVDFPIGLNEGESYTHGHFTFYGIPAAHNELEKDQQGNCRYMGYVIRFGNWTIYHSGDTLLYNGQAERLIPFDIDIALLPINGNDPSRGVAGNLNSEEAIRLAKDIHADCLIPCHFDMFTFNTADSNAFMESAMKEKQKCCVLDIGGKLTSHELGEEAMN